jgi:hypothetical protein
MFDPIDQLIGKVMKEVSKKTGKLIEEIGDTLDLDALLSPGRKREANSKLSKDLNPPKWSTTDLHTYIQNTAISGNHTLSPPDSFDFSAFAPVCDRLLELGKDGRERARTCFVDRLSGAVKFGKTHVGDTHSVKYYESFPFKMVPVMAIHNHPTSGNLRGVYHLSPQDFLSFLQRPSKQFEVMVASGITIIAMRTHRTPPFSETVESEIKDMDEQIHSPFTIDRARAAMNFTREVCRVMDIALFRIKHSDGDNVARAVLLK